MPQNQTPDSKILRITVFGSKNLSSTERHYKKTNREEFWIFFRLEIFHYYALADKQLSTQTTHHYISKGCGNTVTMTAVHTTQNMPKQNMHYIQTRCRSIYSRPAIKTQIYWKPKLRDYWHAHWHKCHQQTYKYACQYETYKNSLACLCLQQMQPKEK